MNGVYLLFWSLGTAGILCGPTLNQTGQRRMVPPLSSQVPPKISSHVFPNSLLHFSVFSRLRGLYLPSFWGFRPSFYPIFLLFLCKAYFTKYAKHYTKYIELKMEYAVCVLCECVFMSVWARQVCVGDRIAI